MADDIEAKAKAIGEKYANQGKACKEIIDAAQKSFDLMQNTGQANLVAMSNLWSGDNANLYFKKQSDNLCEILTDYNQIISLAYDAYKETVATARAELTAIGVDPDKAGIKAIN